MLKTILHTAMMKLFGVLVGTVKIRPATFPQHMIRTTWLNLENGAPVNRMVQHHVDQTQMIQMSCGQKVLKLRECGRAATAMHCLSIHSFSLCPGIAYGDAYVSLRTSGCCLSGLIASPYNEQLAFERGSHEQNWTNQLQMIQGDTIQMYQDSVITSQRCAKRRFPLPLPFPLPFPLPPLPPNEENWEKWQCSSDIKMYKEKPWCFFTNSCFQFQLHVYRFIFYLYILNHTYHLYMHTSTLCNWDTALIRQLGSSQYFAATEHWTLNPLLHCF